MRMKRSTKTAVLLLSLVIMLGFANCAMARSHHNSPSRNVLGLTITLKGLNNQHNYYHPNQGRYSYYPDYYMTRRELAMQERYLYQHRKVSYNCHDRRRIDYYRY